MELHSGGTPALECRALRKEYGRTVALQNVNLSLQSGRIVGLVGPNGSGKTTLIKLAQHLLVPTEGEIRILGMEPGPETKALVSYLPDRDFLPQWMDLNGLLEFYCDFYADFRPDKAQEMLNALHIDSKLPLGRMSKGTREKVQLILTMSREARVYLLDEPIAGVDPATREYILHTILSGYTSDALMVISTHLITDVEPILEEVVFLQNGSVALHENTDALRQRTGMSIDGYFREVYRCWEN
ncbi:MAG: ABC transporter ATP-binding protein [Lachnospiraceae bacterium]|nr:ABC transporter ATP-binding protein [Lachnospiraceae bacterium]